LSATMGPSSPAWPSCAGRSSLGSSGTTSHRASRSSFNGRLRDELLNETLFSSLDHAREMLAEWRDDYNTVRPHSGIGNLPPSTYSRLTASDMQRDGTLRRVEGSVPLHHRATQAQMTRGFCPSLDDLWSSGHIINSSDPAKLLSTYLFPNTSRRIPRPLERHKIRFTDRID
jgi:hypothetical protein